LAPGGIALRERANVGAPLVGARARDSTGGGYKGRPYSAMAAYFAVCGSSPAAFQRSAEPALASIFTKAAAGSAALAVAAAS
jgi:hypothetical protein